MARLIEALAICQVHYDEHVSGNKGNVRLYFVNVALIVQAA